MSKKTKIRVNITVDKDLLNKAKTKLDLFGGKLSTLFNAYLLDFVETMEKGVFKIDNVVEKKFKELEEKLKKIEDKLK